MEFHEKRVLGRKWEGTKGETQRQRGGGEEREAERERERSRLAGKRKVWGGQDLSLKETFATVSLLGPCASEGTACVHSAR